MSTTKDLYLENIKVNQREIQRKSFELVSKPRRLMMVLTGRCNISCIMCDRKASSFTLPVWCIKNMIDLFPYLDLVAWQGGEVFLVDYFKDFFREVMRYPQLAQEINTNGLLFDKEWIEMIGGANTKLIFSIDSTDKNTYEYIRRGAKFENLIKNINLFKELEKNNDNLKLERTINIVVMRSNYKTLEAFIDFALEYNFSGLNFLNMIGDICPQENIFRPLDLDVINYLRNKFPSIIKKAEFCGLKISHELSPFLYDNKFSKANEEQNTSNVNGLFCLMPWKSLFIDGSQKGAVYPECLCRKPVGNIFKNSLDEIWNSEDMQKYRKKIANQDLANWCNPNCVKGLVNKDFLQKM